ncbi:MAG TPA: DUF1634 domain-containing protein [Terriglobia bacterium]|nr:DUF1634 domain-containing protein [Terriglobia bacterium]
MANRVRQWTDQYVEEWIGNLLRAGVTLAAVVVLFGGSVYLARHGYAAPQYHVFVGEPTDLRTISGIMKDVLAFRGRGLIQLGLLLLIATPVARVAFSVAAFALQRDRLYVVVTLIVFAILIYSLAGGHG